MGLAILLFVIAVILFGVGAAVEGALWLLFIAGVLALISIFLGIGRRNL